MRMMTITVLLIAIACTGAMAMDYSGWYRGKLDWEAMDNSLSVTSAFSGKVQWTDAIRTSMYLSLDEDGIHRLRFTDQWYVSSYRWQARINFTADGFDYASLKWSYFTDLWEAEWESELDAGGPLSWTGDVSFNGPPVQWDVTADFTDLLTFSSVNATATFPLPHAWNADVTWSLDTTRASVFSQRSSIYGPLGGGKFTIDCQDLVPTTIEFDRAWQIHDDSHEIDVEWDTDTGIQCSYTYQHSETNGGGTELTLRATAGPPIEVNRAEWDVYSNDWYLYFDFIDQELGITISRDLPSDMYLEVDASYWLADNTQEVEAYLEGDTFSLGVDWSFVGGAPDELVVTIKLYF